MRTLALGVMASLALCAAGALAAPNPWAGETGATGRPPAEKPTHAGPIIGGPAHAEPSAEGWTHSCTLVCENQQTGQSETIERLGRNKEGGAVCKQKKLLCESGRSAACVTAAALASKEPLYKNCQAVVDGECTKSCSFEP
jgi:hypothetical protein